MKAKTIDAVLMVGLFIFLIFATSYIGPSLDDNGPEHEVARQELEKQRQQERFSKAAKEICGNGYALVDAGGDVTCQVRKALRAGKQL